jgi:hypothetical protein
MKGLSKKKSCTLLLIAIMIAVCQFLSGCIAAEFLAESEGLGGLSTADLSAADAIVGSENSLLLERGFAANSTGDLVVSDAVRANTLLERVHLVKTIGESPKLFIEGKTEPFGEIYANSGKLKLSNGKLINISDKVFSVDSKAVSIMLEPTNSSAIPNRVVTTVKQGNLLVKLTEKNGWYQVKFARNSTVFKGWINPIFLAPLILAPAKKKRIDEFPNIEEMKSDLIGNATNEWKFQNVKEFKDFQIVEQKFWPANLLYITVNLKLMDKKTDKLFNAQVILKYMYNEDWIFSNVIPVSFAQASQFEVTTQYIQSLSQNNNSNLGNSSVSSSSPWTLPTTNSEASNPQLSINNNITSNTQLSVNNNITSNNNITTINSNTVYTKPPTTTQPFIEYRNPFSGNFTFNANSIISTSFSGDYIIGPNVNVVLNGTLTGKIVLNKGATLTVNGIFNGTILNYGGTIVQKIAINGNIINYQ